MSALRAGAIVGAVWALSCSSANQAPPAGGHHDAATAPVDAASSGEVDAATRGEVDAATSGEADAATAPVDAASTAPADAAADRASAAETAPDPSASKLALAAAALAPGHWAIFKANDKNAGDALSGTNLVNCDWMNKTDFWPGATPYHGRIAFHTSPANTETPWYTVVYDERTDSWERDAGNLATTVPGHAYDHNCIDPEAGLLYSAVYYDDSRILRYDVAAKAWLGDLAVPADLHMGQQPAYSLVWHRAPAGLVWLSGAGKIAFWNKSSAAWTLVRGDATVGEYHNVGAHNATAGITVVGGGNDSSALYAVYHDGAKMVANPISPAPPFGAFQIGFGGNDRGVLVAPNPAARTFIFLTMSGACWELDAGTAAAPAAPATWKSCAAPIAPFTGNEAVLNAFVVALPAYGALMYAKWLQVGEATIALFKP